MIRTHDCDATLTDTQVLDFCASGVAIFEAVVPDDANRRVRDYCDGHDGDVPLDEDWYVNNVFLNETVVGAIRSLMGADFGYRHCKNHRAESPGGGTGGWHRDGGSVYTLELDSLQAFYYPQDTPVALGPTEVVPGSHLFYAIPSHMGHYGAVRGQLTTAAPAGTIFVTAYPIWHRRGAATVSGTRNLIKYWYRRTTPPTRDWIVESDFNLPTTYAIDNDHAYSRDKHRTRNDAAKLFYWLCGKPDEFQADRQNLPVYYPW